MRLSRACVAALAGLGLIGAISGCGSSGAHVPDAGRLPLVAGARPVFSQHRCDGGAGAYCAVYLVIYDRRFRSSEDLLTAERHELHAHGWTGANGDVGPESAADSPGHKLHLSYATAADELSSSEQGWVQRPREVTLALSHSIFGETPALAMILEFGSGAS